MTLATTFHCDNVSKVLDYYGKTRVEKKGVMWNSLAYFVIEWNSFVHQMRPNNNNKKKKTSTFPVGRTHCILTNKSVFFSNDVRDSHSQI